MKTNESYIIFECAFDLQTNLVATMVVHSIKNHYPERKIVVMTNFPEVWFHNPDIFRFYKFDHISYFFDDFIKDKDTLIFKHNPILTDGYIQKEKHLAEIWCDLYNIKLTADAPLLYFTWREKEAVQKLTKAEKPIFLIESEPVPYGFGHSQLIQKNQSWQDTLPLSILATVVREMNKKGFLTVDISETATPPLPGTERLNLDLRLKLCAIKYSTARLFINSFAQHASACFGLPSVVTWVSNPAKVWGYDIHQNIEPSTDKKTSEYIKSHIKEFSFINQTGLCPFDLSQIYDTKEILKKLEMTEKKID